MSSSSDMRILDNAAYWPSWEFVWRPPNELEPTPFPTAMVQRWDARLKETQRCACAYGIFLTAMKVICGQLWCLRRMDMVRSKVPFSMRRGFYFKQRLRYCSNYNLVSSRKLLWGIGVALLNAWLKIEITVLHMIVSWDIMSWWSRFGRP